MIRAYVAPTEQPVIWVEVPAGRITKDHGTAVVELTPDEAADLADQLAHAADLCGAACAVASCNAHPIGTHGMCVNHD